MSLRLHDRLRVDMTIDKAIRVINVKVFSNLKNKKNTDAENYFCELNPHNSFFFFHSQNNIVLALSGSGSAAALMHPNGRVYQYGSRVEIVAHDINHGNNKLVFVRRKKKKKNNVLNSKASTEYP